MEKPLNKTELIPKYSYVPFAAMLTIHLTVYYATKPLQAGLTHHTLNLPIDYMIPFLPDWSLIYALTFFFWAGGAVIFMLQDRETCFRMYAGLGVAEIICAVFFVAFPTEIARPEIQGTIYGAKLLSVFYANDIPVNLFPSMHCMMSYMMFRYFMYCKNTNNWYIILAGLFVALVCASTVFVKQHYFIDSIAGIVLGEVSVWVGMRTSAWKVFDRLDRKLYKQTAQTINT